MGPISVPEFKIYLWILDQSNFGLKSKLLISGQIHVWIGRSQRFSHRFSSIPILGFGLFGGVSIVLPINGIYTKSGKLHHRPTYRLSIIGPIVTVSRLSFASAYSTICTKSIVIAYKICYKWQLYFGLPGV